MSQKNSVIQRICCNIYVCNLNLNNIQQYVNKTPVCLQYYFFAQYTEKKIKMLKQKSDDEFEILKKKQILLNSYFCCSSCFNEASKTKKTSFSRALTRHYRGCLTTPCQLKLAEYFPNWVFPKFLNPIKLKNKYYWFLVHTRSYKLQFDHLLITILH